MIHLAFYRGPGNIITHLIRLITFGPFSHVELVFSDGTTFEISGHGPNSGVHFHKKEYTTKDWVFFGISLREQEEGKLRSYCHKFIGERFSFMGLWAFLFPFLDSDKYLYCSRGIVMAFQESLGMFKNLPLKISPNNMFRYFDAISSPKRKLNTTTE